METVHVIHEHAEQKVEPFWWIFYFIALSVAFLTGLAFIMVPPLLYVMYGATWLLILFILIPAGLWMVKRLYQYTKKLIWHNNHLSSYVLQEENIKVEEWKEVFREKPFRRSIDVSSIRTVIVSSYIVRQTRTLRSQGGTGATITETAPILYVLYSGNIGEKIVSIPFSVKDPGINTWLEFFQHRNIPLKYTAHVLFRKDMEFANDEQRLDFLKSTEDPIDFSFSGNWQTQAPELWREWMKKESRKQAEEEAANPELRKKRAKHSFSKWMSVTLVVYALVIAATFGTIELAKREWISAESMVPGLVIFLLGGLVYFFLLRTYMRWYYIPIFAIKVFIWGFLILLWFEEEGELADQMATSIGATSILFPAIVWIPYFIVKWLTNKKIQPTTDVGHS